MTSQPEPDAEAMSAAPRDHGRAGGRVTPTRPPRGHGAVVGAGDRGGSGARVLTAFDIVVVGAVTILLATLLNADGLSARARRLPVSSDLRKPAVSLTDGLLRVTRGLGLDRPADALNKYRGDAGDRGGTAGNPADGTDPVGGDTGTTVTGATDPTSAPAADPANAPANAPAADPAGTATDPAGGSAGTAAGDPATPTVTAADVAAPPRVPTAADPAQIYVAGDSLAKDLAIELVPLVAQTKVAVAQSRVRVGTGLVRPDSFNWPAQLKTDLASLDPAIVVVEFGGNDTQGILLPDGTAIQHPTDPGWDVEYAKRVAAVIDQLTKGGRKLVWVGAPMARDEAQNAGLEVIHRVVADQVAKHPGVDYVDTWELFKSPAGQYADYIFVDGDFRQVRQNDGFHLNPTGVKYLAGKVIERITTELKARGATV